MEAGGQRSSDKTASLPAQDSGRSLQIVGGGAVDGEEAGLLLLGSAGVAEVDEGEGALVASEHVGSRDAIAKCEGALSLACVVERGFAGE